MTDNVELTFSIGDLPFLILKLNLKNQTSQVVYHTDNQNLIHVTFQENEWTYPGIQYRLQWWFNTKKALPEMLVDFQQYGFHFGGQANIHLKIKEIA